MDLKGSCYAFFYGLRDSFKGILTLFYLDKEMNDRLLSRLSPSTHTPVRRKATETEKTTPIRTLKDHEESKVLKRTFQCCLLNGGIFLLSLLFFERGFMPGIYYILQIIFGAESYTQKLIWSWMEPTFTLIYKTLWIVPLFLLSKFINSLWFQDIADAAYRYSRGRPQLMQSLSTLLADSIFSILVQTLFLIQAMLVKYIPIYMLGDVLSFVHMCLLYSLYAFEYKWFNMGWELHKRLTYIETNWPYFIGFGLPLAVFTDLTDSWCFNGGIFGILFPLFIISGNEATPITGVCDYPLHLFSPVITLSNSLVTRSLRPTPQAVATGTSGSGSTRR